MATPGQDALAEAARLEAARVYGTVCPEHRSAEPEQPATVFARPLDTYYGPAPAATRTELVEALQGDAPGRDRIAAGTRRSIEQAIARGESNGTIASGLPVDVTVVRRVRADLDRLSA
jgi:hypothetical protein